MNGITPTQERILRKLGDGLIHRRSDLMKYSGLSSAKVFAVHLCHLRKRVRATDSELDIVTITGDKGVAFRLVRLEFTTLDKTPLIGFISKK